MGRLGKCDFLWTFTSKLVPRVMVLLVRNHVNLSNWETCHVSPIHLLCRFRCQGPLLINSRIPSLPSSFMKFPSLSILILDLRLEVSCVHSFSLVLDPGIFLSSSLVFKLSIKKFEIVLSSSSNNVDKAINEYTSPSSFSGSSDSNSSGSGSGSSSEGNTTEEYESDVPRLPLEVVQERLRTKS